MEKKKLEEHIKTFLNVTRLLNQKGLTKKYQGIALAVDSLSKNTDRLIECYNRPLPHGNSKLKKEQKKRLAIMAHGVSSAVYAYAQITGNTIVKNAVHYTPSDFFRPQDTTTIGRCRQVLNAAKKIKNAEQYGLFPHIIEGFSLKIEEYNIQMNRPMKIVKDHARAMRLAEKLVKVCLNILSNQIDPLMVNISRIEKDLIFAYTAQRRINKPIGRKRKYVKKEITQQDEMLITQVATEEIKIPASALQEVNT